MASTHSAITKVPVGVAIAAVAGTTRVVRFSRWGRNAAVAAAPTPANAMSTWWRRFGKLTSLAVVASASSLWRMRTPRKAVFLVYMLDIAYLYRCI